MAGLIGQYGALFLRGALTTLLLFGISWVGAVLLAFGLLFLRASRVKPLEWLVVAFVEYHRNVPGIVQLLVWYFGVPQLLPDDVQLWINERNAELLFAAIALSLNSAAYMSEDLRSGLRAVSAQQMEAARALGLRYGQALRDVVLPQAVRLSIPALVNQTLNLFKATSLAIAIGVAEMTYVTREVDTITYRTFDAFAIATLFYLLLCFAIVWAGGRVQDAWSLRR